MYNQGCRINKGMEELLTSIVFSTKVQVKVKKIQNIMNTMVR